MSDEPPCYMHMGIPCVRCGAVMDDPIPGHGPSETLAYALADLEEAIAIAKMNDVPSLARPWPQRKALFDADVALSHIRVMLEREGVLTPRSTHSPIDPVA